MNAAVEDMFERVGNRLQARPGNANLTSENGFRSSAKYTDTETGLLYYGYRYYDGMRGRWISGDPIQEVGGVNLYTFVENFPTELIDILGRESWGPFPHTTPLPAPPSTPPGISTAGPDVTATLIATHLAVIQKFWQVPKPKRICACKTLYKWIDFGNFTDPITGANAWEIQDLNDLSRGRPGALLGATLGTGQWATTVQLQYHGMKSVYYAGDVNYTLWGWMNALCELDSPGEYPLSRAVGKARDWRTRHWPWQTITAWQIRGANAAEAFTGYGYMGTDPGSASLPTDAQHTASPSNVLGWPIFYWVWEPIKPRNP